MCTNQRNHQQPVKEHERSFMLGDFWTGSVLLDDDWKKVCVIDWELAGVDRGLSYDMGIFLAQLHLHLLAAQTATAKRAIRTLIRSTVEEYRANSLPHPFPTKPKEWRILNPHPTAAQAALRSAFISHGRKMINNAVEWTWKCDCENQAEEDEQHDQSEKEGQTEEECHAAEKRRAKLQARLELKRQAELAAQVERDMRAYLEARARLVEQMTQSKSEDQGNHVAEGGPAGPAEQPTQAVQAVHADQEPQGKQDGRANHDCRLVANMVERGLWYLRIAGQDLEQFVKEENWAEVLTEDEGILLSLFWDMGWSPVASPVEESPVADSRDESAAVS
jgi:hypothetical protein